MASALGPASSSGLLEIWAATYSTAVVTEQITLALIKPDSSLSIESDKLNDSFGDPWSGNPKSFSMIYVPIHAATVSVAYFIRENQASFSRTEK